MSQWNRVSSCILLIQDKGLEFCPWSFCGNRSCLICVETAVFARNERNSRPTCLFVSENILFYVKFDAYNYWHWFVQLDHRLKHLSYIFIWHKSTYFYFFRFNQIKDKFLTIKQTLFCLSIQEYFSNDTNFKTWCLFGVFQKFVHRISQTASCNIATYVHILSAIVQSSKLQ